MKAYEGDSIAIQAVLDHYAGYIVHMETNNIDSHRNSYQVNFCSQKDMKINRFWIVILKLLNILLFLEYN
ncbi:MAG: helix-turn-helix domain-containing protein [Catenibacterium mitsuokai]|nr:helix-turn-helix domain-containing protein [Catenibacterium mitsuokai]MDD6594588.1 helix-turn-helix domain-containing protein [Catenibacterium mitsuokai]